MYYEHIQQALDKVQATLSKKELEELLQENQSYLCTEFRPEFSYWFEDTLDTLYDDSISAIMSTVDEAKECANFLVSKGVFNAKDLVIHELTLSVSKVINITYKEQL